MSQEFNQGVLVPAALLLIAIFYGRKNNDLKEIMFYLVISWLLIGMLDIGKTVATFPWLMPFFVISTVFIVLYALWPTLVGLRKKNRGP